MALNRNLSELGLRVAEFQDEALLARSRPPVHERLAAIHRAHARKVTAGRRVSFGTPLALAAMVAVAFVVAIALRSRERPLDFVVGASREPGTLGVWISALAGEPKGIAFSDGSAVRLAAGAQARVVSTDAHGARVVIERGTIRADVVPRSRNDWWVVGGPYEIHVVGTSFDARWEPEREELRIVMYEGHVEVRGGCLSPVRSLFKGDSVTISCSTKTAVPTAPTPELTVPSALPRIAAVAPALPSAGHEADAPPARRPNATKPLENSSAAPPSWHSWAKLGAYKEALAAAENEGFDELCATLSIGELLELATTARLAGKLVRASEAYSAVRGRFSGTDGAATAAFHLGQIAFDGTRSYPQAHRWFAIYLSERPSGTLAAEALGRLMEAEQRLGDLVTARVTASTYVQRYPTGAHVRLARSILGP
jgi:TolA-binding protein